ncbi:MAG: hypothetical protein HY852_26980 [Bradyrhizobium sp.]|uniref:hypothetical protein n=1 Tax=Bradyrhizobium sp. TaxID=376 RepID=UPI0025BD78C8|nr:hypothetical protein [Bradyrhizobium sp.]MBI5265454.1 hypothetical protein [Bradyrhizobium sp.]
MLPGFRFLFAAILLSTSVLVFGLGAAALLRATHEEFVSNPSWRTGPQEQVFAPPTEPREAVLAALRVEPPPAELNSPEPASPAPAPEAVTPPAKEPEHAIVVTPEAAAEPESQKLELAAVSQPTIGLPQQSGAAPTAEPAAPASAPGPTETPASDAKLAAVQEALAAVEVAAPAAENPVSSSSNIKEQAADGAAPGNADAAVTKTAALPDPTAAAEQQSQAEKSVTEQRVQRARKRHRTARRSPPPPQPPVAPIFDPFAPLVQPAVKQTGRTR